MEKKLVLLLLAIGAFVVFFGVKGITGAATGDVSGSGLFGKSTIVSVVAIVAIAGLVIATQIANRK